MSFTNVLHNRITLFGIFLALAAFTVVTVITLGTDGALAAEQASEFSQAQPEVLPQAQRSDPEANLPFLFAVYIITWAAFFVYIFYVSRKQREMRREIDALQRALTERERRESQAMG